MKTPPPKPGFIFADLHCHLTRPKNKKQAENLVKKLSSGITGITSVWNSDITTYSQLVQDLGSAVNEIEPGLLARVNYRWNKGYILKTQEVAEGRISTHFLALAPEKYIPNDLPVEQIPEEAKKQGALSGITHPFTIPATVDDFLINKILRKPYIKYRIINGGEEKRLFNLYPLVDFVETDNAQNVKILKVGSLTKYLPYQLHFLDMNSSNQKAEESVKDYNAKTNSNLPCIASSDTHGRLEQIQKAGIYLPEEKESYLLESILENVKTGNFEKYEQYISIPSFAAGMFPIAGKIYDIGPYLFSLFKQYFGTGIED